MGIRKASQEVLDVADYYRLLSIVGITDLYPG